MGLTLVELAPYLPYNVRMLRVNRLGEFKVIHLSTGNIGDVIEHPERYTLILRTLSDLTIDELKNDFYGCQDGRTEDDWIFDAIEGGHKFTHGDFENLTHRGVSFLLKNHFDIFGLYEKGLAVNVNTLTDGNS